LRPAKKLGQKITQQTKPPILTYRKRGTDWNSIEIHHNDTLNATMLLQRLYCLINVLWG
jgi:hypothetical protein